MSARAASELGFPLIISSQSSAPMEQIAAASDGGPLAFQLYAGTDRGVTASFVRRAEAIGARFLVLTVDNQLLGFRSRTLDRGYSPFARGHGLGSYFSDPRFSDPEFQDQILKSHPEPPPARVPLNLSSLKATVELARNYPGSTLRNLVSGRPRKAVQVFSHVFANDALTWEDLDLLRSVTHLPIVVKGILHPDDARAAVRRGASGIMVSNHGGRQIDGAVASLDALPAVVRAVKSVSPDTPVLFDSGIRSGADAFKALALGADAVGVGRPMMYGLAIDGAAGVTAVGKDLRAGLDITMALAGARSIREIPGKVR